MHTLHDVTHTPKIHSLPVDLSRGADVSLHEAPAGAADGHARSGAVDSFVAAAEGDAELAQRVGGANAIYTFPYVI